MANPKVEMSGSGEYLTEVIETIPDDEKKAGSMMVGEMMKNVSARTAHVPCYEFYHLKDLAGIIEHLPKSECQQFENDEKIRGKYKTLLGATRQSVFFDAITSHERSVINRTYRAVAKMGLLEKFVDFCKEVWRDWTRAHELEKFDDIVIRSDTARLVQVDRIKQGPISYLKTCIQILGRDVQNAGEEPRGEEAAKRLKAHKFSAKTSEYIDKYTTRALERIRQLEQKDAKPKEELKK